MAVDPLNNPSAKAVAGREKRQTPINGTKATHASHPWLKFGKVNISKLDVVKDRPIFTGVEIDPLISVFLTDFFLGAFCGAWVDLSFLADTLIRLSPRI